MANAAAVILSVIFLITVIFTLLYFIGTAFRKGKKTTETPVKKENAFTRIYGKLKGKLKRGDKKRKIKALVASLLGIIVLIAVIGYITAVGAYLATPPIANYTYSSTANLSSNWDFWPGTWVVRNGCLFGEGEIKLKRDLPWKKIELIPCRGQSWGTVGIVTGQLVSKYWVGQPPIRTPAKAHVGSISLVNGGLVSKDFHKPINKGDSDGPFPISVAQYPWWIFTEDRTEIRISLLNEPIPNRALAGTWETPGANNIAIQSGGTAGIKEVRIY